MLDITLNSGWDTALLVLAIIVGIGFGIFRLDVIVFRSQRTMNAPGSGSGTDADGEPILSDPDGRPWASQTGSE
jgi:hypothetical protein